MVRRAVQGGSIPKQHNGEAELLVRNPLGHRLFFSRVVLLLPCAAVLHFSHGVLPKKKQPGALPRSALGNTFKNATLHLFCV